MEVRITHRGGVEFAAEARGKAVWSSATRGAGGADDALMPTELLLASLGTCAGYYAAKYMLKEGLPMEGFAIRVKADTLRDPPRLGNFRIAVSAPGVPAGRAAALREEVLHCTVHNTLTADPASIELVIETAPDAQA